MNWQDVVFTFAGIFFCLSLLPSLFSEHKPSIWTSTLTGGWLCAMAAAYYSIGFVMVAIITLVSVLEWWTLAVQEFRRKD